MWKVEAITQRAVSGEPNAMRCVIVTASRAGEIGPVAAGSPEEMDGERSPLRTRTDPGGDVLSGYEIIVPESKSAKTGESIPGARSLLRSQLEQWTPPDQITFRRPAPIPRPERINGDERGASVPLATRRTDFLTQRVGPPPRARRRPPFAPG